MAKNKEYELAIKIAGQIEKSFGSSINLTKKELRNISKEASASSKSIKESFSDGIASLEGGFGALEKGTLKTFSAISKAAAATGTAITGAVAASLKVGIPFEAQMSTVEAISGATAKEMKLLNDKAKEMGANTVFTATQAGEAMEYMAMAGWEAEHMLNGIEGIMYLAAASGEELGMVSDIVTDAMTAMNMSVTGTTEAIGKDGLVYEVQNATHFANVLAAASSSSNTNVAMLGESFKYCAPLAGAFGFSIEDTALALGLMANSGIKASQSGTAFRKILTQLATDFAVMQKDGTDFIVTTTNIDGSMRSLKEILDDTREAFTGMSQAQKEAMENDISAAARDLDISLENENGALKTQAELYEEIAEAVNNLTEAGRVQEAEALAGKTAMAGLLSLVNASEDDYDRLYEAIMSCNGAAEEMANTRLDNLKGDLTLFGSATDSLGLEAYEGMTGFFRTIVQGATGKANEATRQLQLTNIVPRIVSDIETSIPTAIRYLKDFSQSMYEFGEPLFKIGGWLLENPTVIVSTLAGIGTALATFKVVQGVNNAAKAFTAFTAALSPFSLAILGLTAAAGIIAAVATASAKASREMKRQNLAGHFGSVALSMNELKEAAEHIMKTDSLGKVYESMAAFEDLKGIKNNIQDTMKGLNKLNWKVSMGMELSVDELELYETNVNKFIEDNLEALLQAQYSVNLAADAFLNDDEMGQNIRETLNSFYSKNHQYMQELGEELGQVMAEALQDGMLDIDETAAIIELQNKMATITTALANSEMEAKLDLLQLKYSGAGLDAESFQNLQLELNEWAEEMKTNAANSYIKVTQPIRMAYEAGDLTEQEFQEQIYELNKNYLTEIGDIDLRVASFQTNTIMTQYGEELSVLKEGIENGLMDTFASIELSGNGALAWSVLINDIFNMEEIDSATRDAMADLYERLLPSKEGIEKTIQQMEVAGREVPEALRTAITDIELIGALANDTDALWNVIGDTIENESGYKSTLQALEEAGNGIPQQIAEAMEDNQETLFQASANLYSQTKWSLQKEFSNPIDFQVPMNMNFVVSGTFSSSGGGGNVLEEMKNIDGFATGGIITKPTLATFAEEGPEAAIPLDGSQNAINLWKTAGQMLGVYNSTKQYEAPESLESMYNSLQNNSTTNNNIDDSKIELNFTSNPQLNFYGDAPSKQDMYEALKMSQDDFERMLEEYLRNRDRKMFGR